MTGRTIDDVRFTSVCDFGPDFAEGRLWGLDTMVNVFDADGVLRVELSCDLDGDRMCIVDVERGSQLTVQDVVNDAGRQEGWPVWRAARPRRYGDPSATRV